MKWSTGQLLSGSLDGLMPPMAPQLDGPAVDVRSRPLRDLKHGTPNMTPLLHEGYDSGLL